MADQPQDMEIRNDDGDPLDIRNVTGTVSLPTGAATSTNQTTANTSLSSIDTKLTNPLPVSAATLPLPTGAATAANQATANTSLSSIDSKLTSPISVTATFPANTAQAVLPYGPVSSNSYPNPISAYPLATQGGLQNDYNLTLDVFDNLQIRGPVITDEGSFRDDFSGSSLFTTLTGQLKFSNTSTAIVGVSSTIFTSEVNSGFYIRRSAGADSEFVQVDYVQDDAAAFATTNYSGNFNNQTSVISRWKPSVTGGASYSVSGSILSLVSSTASGNIASVQNSGDYGPYVFKTSCAITQRVANQSAIIGFSDNPSSPARQALVKFDGTSNTTVKLVTSSSATEVETTTVTLPNGATTDSQNFYEIDLTDKAVALIINGIVVATNKTHIPATYDVMTVSAAISNSAIVTTTTLQIEFILWKNMDQLEVASNMDGINISVQGTVNAVPLDSSKSTYSASIVGLVPALLATDIFSITGSSTKVVRISHLEISATQTTAGNINMVLLKRSSANSGGTATNPTKVAHDSANPAATATLNAYTANPTTGSLVGNLRANKLFVSTVTTMGQEIPIDFGIRPGQSIVLRGSAEVLAVNLNGVTVTGGSFDIDIEWTEE